MNPLLKFRLIQSTWISFSSRTLSVYEIKHSKVIVSCSISKRAHNCTPHGNSPKHSSFRMITTLFWLINTWLTLICSFWLSNKARFMSIKSSITVSIPIESWKLNSDANISNLLLFHHDDGFQFDFCLKHLINSKTKNDIFNCCVHRYCKICE